MKRRTDFDFSKNIHTVEIFKSEENEIRVDHFKRPGSIVGYVKFTNTDSNLLVSGDFGNWVFCRPFIPSVGGRVDPHYWNEKLQIGSCQKHAKYDSERTRKELSQLIDSGLEEYGYHDDELKEAKNFLSDLMSFVDDELEYTYHAFRSYNCPIDLEMIPFIETASKRLEIIFDAFDIICERLKQLEK